jgi:hypothetical protein
MGSFQYGMLVEQVSVIATAAGTTTLTNTSKQNEIFTGSAIQTIVLPDATTMSVGQNFNIFNQSTGTLTLEFSGGASFTDASLKNYSLLSPNTSLEITLQDNTSGGTPTNVQGKWAVIASVAGNTTVLKAPSISKFTTGTSATYTTPTSPSPLWLEIIVVGGGAGGAGSGSSGAGVNGNASSVVGNNTTTANGGSGPANQYTGGVGGTFSIGAECTDINSAAGGNGGGVSGVAAASANGGMGGSSALGGAGSGGATSNVGGGASTNSGGGGGGAGGGSSAAPGSGGGAGAYVHCAITGTLKSTYTYTVGASVSGSTGSSAAGGAGAAGMVVFIAHYQ